MKSKGIHIIVTVVISIFIGAGIAWTETITLPHTFESNTPARAAEVNANFAELQANLEWAIGRIYELEAKLAHTRVDYNDINGVAGPHVIFEGANVHVRSGSDTTDDAGSLTGLGNLIIGYNEEPAWYTEGRAGSHNLILGSENQFSSYGGMVAGALNTISNDYATVTGGYNNTASGLNSSVTAGLDNTASGLHSSVSGGVSNIATGESSSISGGLGSTASSHYSSVSGGQFNTASGWESSVSGGLRNVASGWASSVSGGYYNDASGDQSSVSGGEDNTASGFASSVSGGEYNPASGIRSSVSGGDTRSATGDNDWAAGWLFEDF